MEYGWLQLFTFMCACMLKRGRDGFYVFCVDLRTNSDYFPIQH